MVTEACFLLLEESKEPQPSPATTESTSEPSTSQPATGGATPTTPRQQQASESCSHPLFFL